MSEYTYTSSPSYTAASPARPFTPPGGIYPAALQNLSAGELSSDSVASGRSRRGSGAHSPGPAVPPGSLAAVPRSHRFNPLVSNTSNNEVRREEIRRQRIESEQRRRDELRDGYRRLKEALPVSNQKSSKVSLLDRGEYPTGHLSVTFTLIHAVHDR